MGMANISRIRSLWTGFDGAPGYTNIYVAEGSEADAVTAMAAFWGAITGGLPSDVTVTVENTGETVDPATGIMTTAWTAPLAIAHVGADAGSYAAASGAAVTLQTADVVNGRRVHGRIFVVPLGHDGYDGTGGLNPSFLVTLGDAVAGLLTALGAQWVVWHRPIAGTGGSQHPVTGHSINPRGAVLRSRRQ